MKSIIPEERILFQNEACMVINKLCGESSEFPNVKPEDIFPVHRLDMPVSGCLLLARTGKAAAFLSAAFADARKVKRHYWAIIEKSQAANALPPEGELIHWLYEDRKINKSFAVLAGEENPPLRHNRVKPKKAVLCYRMTGQGKNYFFLEIELVTGRHHQIRAQLAALGLHIKGDLKYGAKRSEKAGGIRLHAYSISFPNPLKANETIEVKAMPAMDPLWEAFASSL
ncbi:MAG: RNA pseudouridine synthase [Treponema sp.]|nr:RNA pseudouridine synthase [Treponema sp.]